MDTAMCDPSSFFQRNRSKTTDRPSAESTMEMVKTEARLLRLFRRPKSQESGVLKSFESLKSYRTTAGLRCFRILFPAHLLDPTRN